MLKHKIIEAQKQRDTNRIYYQKHASFHTIIKQMQDKLSEAVSQSVLKHWVNLHTHLKLFAFDQWGEYKKAGQKTVLTFLWCICPAYRRIASLSEMRCERDMNSSAFAFPIFYLISPASTINAMHGALTHLGAVK